MKKLTAGIFTVLVSLVSANGANAAIATQGYVDQEVGTLSGTVSTLTQTVADNKLEAAAATKAVADDLAAYKTQANDTFMDAGEVDSKIESAVTGTDGILKNYSTTTQMRGEIATAKSGAEETAQGYVDALDEELATVAKTGAYSDLTGVPVVDSVFSATSSNAATSSAIATYVNGVKNELSNGVAGEIETIEGNIADLVATDAQIRKDFVDADATTLAAAKKYADDEDKKIEDTIGTVESGKTVVQMIGEAKTAADTGASQALEAYKTTNNAAVAAAQSAADKAQQEVDALETEVANNKSATDTAIENIIKTDGTIDTKVKASADAITEAYETADGSLKQELENKIAAANKAAGDAETNAQAYALEKANAALTAAVGYTDTLVGKLPNIARVPNTCSDATNYCTLTTNGTDFYWEVIKRATGETIENDAAPLVSMTQGKPEALK